ncbi:MAG: hypothetical protein KKE20_07445 [Nanoarchaeota archaeon]|nr:hypothetical protein [Nanoarchaeota archaeon]
MAEDENNIEKGDSRELSGDSPSSPSEPPKKPEGLEEKLGFTTIKGKVMGHDGTNYTAGIGQGHVYLVVHWKDAKGKSYTAEVNEKDIGKLKQQRPDIYDVVMTYKEHFQKQITNDKGEFEFRDVPAADWCYIIKAYVGKENIEADHTQRMGNDGKGGNEVIHGPDLLHEKIRDGVIVPVKDKWEKEYEPKPANDPKTEKFVSGFK